jgi:hypothetical protein
MLPLLKVDGLAIDKLQLTGQNLVRVFNSSCGTLGSMRCFEMKLLNLKLKTRQKQLMGSILLDIMLPSLALTSII